MGLGIFEDNGKNVIYSYKKNPGWYPSRFSFSTWARLSVHSIKAWRTIEEAVERCPIDCKVVKLKISLKEVEIQSWEKRL